MSEPTTPRASRRPWALLTAGVVAVAVGTTVAVVTDSGTSRTSTATTAATTAAPTTTDVTTSTAPPVDPDVLMLTSHTWVRLPIGTGEVPTDSEPSLVFHVDGTVEGFDGCNTWAASLDVVALGAGRVQFDDTFSHDSHCSTLQIEELEFADVEVTAEAGATVLTVSPPGAVDDVEYVAVDSLAPLDAADLVGSWQQHGRARISFLDDGTLQVGACAAAIEWTTGAGRLRTRQTFADQPLFRACAGLRADGAASEVADLVGRLAFRLFDCGVYGFRGNVLTDCDEPRPTPTSPDSSGLRWLQPAPDAEPAFDLARGTAYGFTAGAQAPAESVIDEISAHAGAPTFDSGWYTAFTVDTDDYEDCLGGLPMRIVQWGDLMLGWLQLGTDKDGVIERLWLLNVGDDAGIAETMRFDGTLPAAGTGRSVTSPPMGSDIAEFEAAGLSLSGFTVDDGTSASPEDATTASALTDRMVFMPVRLDDGTVTAIGTIEPGFC